MVPLSSWKGWNIRQRNIKTGAILALGGIQFPLLVSQITGGCQTFKIKGREPWDLRKGHQCMHAQTHRIYHLILGNSQSVTHTVWIPHFLSRGPTETQFNLSLTGNGLSLAWSSKRWMQLVSLIWVSFHAKSIWIIFPGPDGAAPFIIRDTGLDHPLERIPRDCPPGVGTQGDLHISGTKHCFESA